MEKLYPLIPCFLAGKKTQQMGNGKKVFLGFELSYFCLQVFSVPVCDDDLFLIFHVSLII